MHDTTQRGGRHVGAYILCYSLWAVIFVLSLVVLAVWRYVVVDLIAVLIGESYANRALYQLSMLLLGIGAFMLVLGAEAYLRTGVPRRQVVQRFARLAIPLAGAVVLGLLLQVVIQQFFTP
jgi:hypothetical protein